MTNAPGTQDTEKRLFLELLVEDRATIAADLIEIDDHTWAIHGNIAVGGDVIMAEFESEDEAKTILVTLSTPEYGPPGP